MKKLDNFQQLLEMFDPTVHSRLIANWNKPGVTGMVVFECLDMCSSNLGKRSALLTGADCTYKSASACEGQHLNDLPSQRQYPTCYAEKS
jgi:hypothetical protein